MDCEEQPVSPSSCIPAGCPGDGVSTCSGIPQPSIQKAQHNLQERFQQCKSENALLGQLLQDCQAECTRLKSQVKQEKSKATRQQEANKAKVAQLQNDVHAELQQSQELASELKKVKSTASTHAASLRRQEERQRQLEDIIVDLKHELDAAKASEKSAVETASAMKKDVARKELRYRQAAAAANRARDELANEKENRNNAVAAGHAELQATLKQVQNQANEAATAIKQAHDAQTRELRVRVEQLQAERDTLLDKNTELMERVEYAPVENQQSSAVTQPPGALVASNSSSLEAVVAELRTRNHRLQKALAHKFITQASDWKMMLDQKGQHGTSEFAQKAEIVERVQVDDKFRQDLLKVTERLTAVVQLNSELLVDNSKLTQQLQAAEQMLSDARQRVAAAERLTDCHQARRSPLAALRQSSTSCCSAQEMIQEPCYPDVRQTATRVLQEDNQELLATVDSLRKGMHECILAEQDARQMLHEARSSELLATQRLADCHGRVHTLELMRLHDLREMNQLRTCGPSQSGGKVAHGTGFDLPITRRSSMSSKHLRQMQSVLGSGSMEHADMPLSLQALAGL